MITGSCLRGLAQNYYLIGKAGYALISGAIILNCFFYEDNHITNALLPDLELYPWTAGAGGSKINIIVDNPEIFLIVLT